MKATFYNVQGFKGKFTCDIGDNITNITAKLNGTGKTTFFDCLKLLCMPSLFLAEDLEFMINKHCKSCQFSLECDDVTYGFFYDKKQLIYTRQYEGEKATSLFSPYPEVGAIVGVYMTDDTMVNVCDKNLNLFSSSNEQLNFKLIDALTNHQKLNSMLALAETSLETNKNHYKTVVHQLKYTGDQIQRTTHFPNIETFRDILNDTLFVTTHDSLVDTLEALKAYTPASNIIDFYNFGYIGELITLVKAFSVERPLVSEAYAPCLVCLRDIHSDVRTFSPTQTTIEILPIVPVAEMYEQLNQLQFPIDTSILDTLTDLLEAVTLYKITTQVWSHYHIVTLRTLANDLEIYFSNIARIEKCGHKIQSIKESLADNRVDCPIHEDVYLVDGECRHV